MSDKPMSEVDVLDRLIAKLNECESLERACDSKTVSNLVKEIHKMKEKTKGARDKAIRQYRAGE